MAKIRAEDMRQIRLTRFCEEFDMPRTTVFEHIYAKRFPAYKIGKNWYVDVPEFLKWREKEHKRSYKYAEHQMKYGIG